MLRIDGKENTKLLMVCFIEEQDLEHVTLSDMTGWI